MLFSFSHKLHTNHKTEYEQMLDEVMQEQI